MIHFLQYALGISYLLGALWFLLIERHDGFLKWRLLATALSPLAVPVLALVYLFLGGVDLVIKIKDKWF